MHTDYEQYKTGATGWHSISEYQKTKNNIKNKGSPHSPLLPPWCTFFFFASPVSRNPSTLFSANSAQLQDLACFSSPLAFSHCHKTCHQMGGEQRTPWGVCSNGAGELGQQEVLDAPCGWHPLPQNPWPSTLFLSHNQPPTKQGPLIHVCYGFLSPRWQVNGSFVFWAQNESPSSARSKSEGRGDKTWMLLCDAKEKQTGQRHVLQGEQTLPSDLNQKKITIFWYKNRACNFYAAVGFDRSSTHSVNEPRLLSPLLALNIPDQLCHTGQAVSQLTKRKGHKRKDASQVLKNSFPVVLLFDPCLPSAEETLHYYYYFFFTSLQNIAISSR